MKARNINFYNGSFSSVVKSIFGCINAKFVVLLVVAMGMWGGARGQEITGTIVFGSNDAKIDGDNVNRQDDQGNYWNIVTTGTTSFTQNSAFGHIGSSKNPASSITFTTTLPSSVTITSFSAKFGGFSGTAGDITLKVGETTVGSGSLNATYDVIVSNSSAATGTELIVTITEISKGVKVYYITYTYNDNILPIYSVAAQSNNTLLGSVSVENNVITATPGYCSQYANPAYTVMSGSATVYQNGNTFTVTPTSDCNIRINFESKPTYNVTWHVSGQADDVYNYCSGSTITAPSNPASCDGEKVFVGWSTAPVDETDVAPTLYSKAQLDGTIVSANLNYYAVFATATGSGRNGYEKVTSNLSDWSGEYLLVYEGEESAKVWTGVDAANCNVDATVSDGYIATKPNEAVSIIVAGMETGYSIKVNGGVNNGKYISGTSGNNKLNFDGTSQVNTIQYDGSCTIITSNTSVLRFNNAVGDKRFRYYKSDTYTSQKEIQLYRKSTISYSAYTTTCCQGTRYEVSFSPSTFETYTNYETSTLVASHDGEAAGTWSLTCSPAATTSSIASNGTITFEASTEGTYKLMAKFTPSGAGACPSTNSINVAVTDCHIEVPEPTYTATLNTVTLNWSSVANAEKYEIVWEDSEEPLVVTTNTTTINTLPSCSTYSYTIKAIPTEGSGRCASEIYNGTATTTCPSKEFSLVTSTQDLVAGEDYIITSGYTETINVLANQDSNNRRYFSTEVSAGKISFAGDEIASLTTDEKAYILTLGGVSGEWTLYDAVNEGYLYAASSSSNYLRTQAENDDNGKWTISFDEDGAAIITAQGSNSRNIIRYNSNSILFSCYESGQNDVYLFRESGAIKTSVEVISGFGYCEGDETSTMQTFIVSASRIEASTVKLTASADYEICLTENGTYSETISLGLTDGELAGTTIYVRLKTGRAAGNYFGSVTTGGYNGNTMVVGGPSVQLSGIVLESSITSLSYSCATNETMTINVGSTCSSGQRYAIAIREGNDNVPHSLGTNETIAVGTSFGSTSPQSWVVYNAVGEVPSQVTAAGVVPGTVYKVQAYKWDGTRWNDVKVCKITTPQITGLTYSDLQNNYGSFSWTMTNALCGDNYNYVVTYSTDHIAEDCASANNGHSSGTSTHYTTTETLTSGTTYYARVFLLFDGELCSASEEISFTPAAITILEPGDLAVIGINNKVMDAPGDGGPDEISFVIFKDIANGTSIDFTDNGYERKYEGYWGTTEGIFRLTWNGGSTLENGSVITISETQGNIGSTTASPLKPPVVGTNINVYTNGVLDNSHWSISMLSPGPLDINDLDQLWFMQGGSWEFDASVGTEHNAYYTGNVLYGFTASGWLAEAGYDKQTIDGISRGTRGSTMFPGQDCFTTNVMMNHGIAKYTGTLEPATKREWITRLNDKDNWTSYVNVEAGGVVTYGRDLYNAAERNYRTYSGKFSVEDGEAFTAGKWSGTKNGNWCNCANWLSLAIPNEQNDVIVPPVTTNDLLLTADEESVAKCKSLTILDGGTITNEDGAKLWVLNDITIEDGGTFEPSSGNELNLYLGGDIVNNGTFKTSEKMSLTLTSENPQTIADVSSGDFVLNNLTFTADGHTFAADEIKLHGDYSATENGLGDKPISFVGSAQQKITNTTAISNLTMNNSGDGVVITSGQTLTITDEATFTDGALQGNVIFNADAIVAGDLTYNSYVQGSVTKMANEGLFTFPTGSNGMLGSVYVGSLDADVTVNFGHDPDGFSTDVIPSWWNQNNMCEGEGDNDKFDHVSNMLNWNISTAADIDGVTFLAVSSADVQFNEATENRNADAIKVAVYDGCWKNIGGTADVVDDNENSIHQISISGVDIARTNRAGGQITFGSTNHPTLLPIELLFFSASCEGTAVAVSWSTASENDNDYFVLERSADAVNFTEITRVKGAGNSIETLYYSYNDNSANNGDNYYRLVQVDYDGTRSASEMIVATCYDTNTNQRVDVYPNPFADEVNIVLENFNGNAEVVIFDMLGRVIYERKLNVKGQCEFIVDYDFAPATYNLRITSGDVVINKQIVKQ